MGYDLYCQMVTEAVADMKGETVREPAEVRLDLPMTANLPREYVSNEASRLEAYRRLAAVTEPSQVDDIETEWADRYGPVPDSARTLLTVARLRAECHRLGLHDISISSNQARLGPIELKLSQATRLRRLSREAKWKEDLRQLVVPVPRSRRGAVGIEPVEPAEFLVGFLRELIPPEPVEVASDP